MEIVVRISLPPGTSLQYEVYDERGASARCAGRHPLWWIVGGYTPRSMSPPPRALIFDMDGVLIDSEPLWHEAEIAAAGEAGLVLTPEDCLRTTGLRGD